mmetsp:Transcript_76563/g.232095  ORF Transcript_76563/g.232095 Transcript_76563/m.232095 type:complete len:270 (-) Transcript_76563:632-1441(-)
MPPKAARTMPSIFSLSSGRKHVQPRASKDSKEPCSSCRSASSRPRLRTGTKSISRTSPPTWTYVKISRMHQRRLRYVVPQSITSREQPLRKTGKLRRSDSMSFWSMQHLSSQTFGSREWEATKAERQLCSAAHLAAASSCQEWETKASHCPSLAGVVRAKRLGSGRLSATSCCVSLARLMQRKRSFACLRASFTEQSPTRPAMPAAEAWALWATKAWCSRSCSHCRSWGRRITKSETEPVSTTHQSNVKVQHMERCKDALARFLRTVNA